MNKKSSALLTMGTLTLLAGGGVVLTNLPDSFKIQRVYAATSRDITVYPKDLPEKPVGSGRKLASLPVLK